MPFSSDFSTTMADGAALGLLERLRNKGAIKMLGTHDLPTFMLASLLLNVTAGPDTLYIVSRSVSQGRRAVSASMEERLR